MDITTIKLHKNTKNELDEFKSKNESYDEIIRKLISKVRNKDLKNRLIEGYKKMGEKELKILEEWENASNEIIWKY